MNERLAGRPPAAIKVIGVGGGGCNAVRRMLTKPTPGVEYIVCNTDIKSLDSCPTTVLSVQIGEHLTRGFGAGGDVTVGARAADEGRFLLKRAVKDAELVFITAGMGGGTGTGAAPVVAQIAKESRALVIAVVTTPFSFEGNRRCDIAITGLRRLMERVNSTIIVPNDHLLRLGDHDVPVQRAFAAADNVVAEGITAISELVNVPGEINVDLADVRKVMGIPGIALMATGWGEGTNAAEQAAEEVVFEPLLDSHVNGAKGTLFCFSGGPDLTLGGVEKAANLISKQVDPHAVIFFGMNLPSEELTGKVKINLVATGIKPAPDNNWFLRVKQGLKQAQSIQLGRPVRLGIATG